MKFLWLTVSINRNSYTFWLPIYYDILYCSYLFYLMSSFVNLNHNIRFQLFTNQFMNINFTIVLNYSFLKLNYIIEISNINEFSL